ncbi:hypothetical protein QYM36_012714, partial [Artemia franciscana]
APEDLIENKEIKEKTRASPQEDHEKGYENILTGGTGWLKKRQRFIFLHELCLSIDYVDVSIGRGIFLSRLDAVIYSEGTIPTMQMTKKTTKMTKPGETKILSSTQTVQETTEIRLTETT